MKAYDLEYVGNIRTCFKKLYDIHYGRISNAKIGYRKADL